MALRAVVQVNLAAIERNVARLRARAGEATLFCAVVKADGYGHGAVPSARAALEGGATWLAVATADEAGELRRAGLTVPILVMGAVSSEELPIALAARADLTAWTPDFVDHVARTRADSDPAGPPVRLHVKLDSGLGRLGTRDPAQALATARRILAAEPNLELVGAMTHFATADEDLRFAEQQLSTFTPFLADLRALADAAAGGGSGSGSGSGAAASAGARPIIAHAANSAATLRFPAAHLDMVRCGIAVYGVDPMNRDPADHQLEPALSLRSYVAALKPIAPGESTGYGRRFIAERPSWLATAPIGYGDGVARRLTNNADVLIGGRRHPLVGTVSMDNITIAVSPQPPVAIGDQVTIIGTDGEERITAEEVAGRLGTIGYEVLCGISRRVPRVLHRDGEPA